MTMLLFHMGKIDVASLKRCQTSETHTEITLGGREDKFQKRFMGKKQSRSLFAQTAWSFGFRIGFTESHP